MVTHGLRENDMEASVSNPFIKLPWPKEDTRAVNKKLPLEDALVDAVQAHLHHGRTEELPRLWRLTFGLPERVSSCRVPSVGRELCFSQLCRNYPHHRPDRTRGMLFPSL